MPGPDVSPKRSDGEHQQERDQEREDPERFGEGDADEEVGHLAGGSRRVAQGARQEVAAAPTGASAPRPTNWTLNLIGVLSISLGVMNLFPIPALDGGRILFTLPEILFRKRIPTQWENMVNGIAMLLLIGLMLFVNVMDFVNPAQIPTP